MNYHLKSKYYFISNFNTKIINKLDKNTTVIYRNYSEKIKDKIKILKFKNFCRNKGINFYLSNDIKLAIQLNLDGAYLPSFNKKFNHLCYSKKKGFEIVGSAHNIKEIRIKERQSVSKIFLSSLFKLNKNYLGINKFKILKTCTTKKIVALGGISAKNLKNLKLVGLTDFAGISYFE